MNEIQQYFDENFYDLDEEIILEIADRDNDPVVNNVIVGRRIHCYGLWLIDDETTIEYQLFYINGSDNELKGHLIKMNLHHPYRHEILFAFSKHIANTYNSDILEIHNTYQEKTCTIAEQIGFMTFDPIELQKLTDDPSPAMMAKGIRGFVQAPMLKHLDLYEFIFGALGNIQTERDISFIYLMFNARTNMVKIGKSKNPNFREKTLQGEEPKITLVAVWKAEHQVERQLHKKYKHKRIRGEWFNLSLQEMKEIKYFMDELLSIKYN